MDSEYAETITKNPLYICLKIIRYLFFLDFLMHWAIKRSDHRTLLLKMWQWQWVAVKYQGTMSLNMSTPGPAMLLD